MSSAREATIRELNEHSEIMRSLVSAPDSDLSADERTALNAALDGLVGTMRRLKLVTN